ncbi:MAG TPA: IPT/TIG domain-containing protein, partial [Acidimicrobiia bacterium]
FVDGATSVSFGGVPASIVSVSGGGTQVVVTTPAHIAGAVDVTVTTADGDVVVAAGFVYVSPFAAVPTVTSLDVSAGPTAGGTTVTITGTNFVDGATTVTFGAVPATVLSVSGDGTQIVVTTAEHPEGTVDIAVTTPAGSTDLVDEFTYLPPPGIVPVVVSLDTTRGPVGGGTTVTITGSGFVDGATVVTFGGVAATVLALSGNGAQMVVSTPPHVDGFVDVTATTSSGSGTFDAAFEYVPDSLTDTPPNEAVLPATGKPGVFTVPDAKSPAATAPLADSPAARALAFTGAGELRPVLLGWLVLFVGAVLVVASRRRRRG